MVKIYLLFIAISLVPVALSYGADPAGMLPKLLKFNVDTSNERQVFRALMCLYLASSASWVIAALTPEWQIAGLIWAVLFMLSLALAWAEVLESRHLFFGANAVDYSGYPDCRPEFMHAYEAMANLATRAAVEGNRLVLHTPIIEHSKADIIRLGVALGVDYALTVSCYQADDDGRACGVCDSCRLRKAGFVAAKVEDPTRYQARKRC